MATRTRRPINSTLFETSLWNFLITDCPTAETLPLFKQTLQKYNCHYVVRFCESTYSPADVADISCTVLDFEFPDGNKPPVYITEQWFNFIESVRSDVFPASSMAPRQQKSTPNSNSQSDGLDDPSFAAVPNSTPSPESVISTSPNPTICAHCVAGLGRAPMLVCLAIMAYDYGITGLEVVTKIRQKRPGALNSEQVRFIMDFEKERMKLNRRKRMHKPKSRDSDSTGCSIM
ncbi:putative Protein tyrosine phosphatase type IVA 3 [Blattamonas nauphoetae]|uniref:Tyrosine specific protein phosphatases domain-containing protein n=1 Tax=Blattamonas nauphoetae TaxID=2049346 RepID=A0ABQ9WSI6_9EUKA|nr:putative Protein tyrosine phosphatase type IVA 3 [Blattamonas nauphoetae]